MAEASSQEDPGRNGGGQAGQHDSSENSSEFEDLTQEAANETSA